MNPILTGQVTLEYVRGGVKKGRPYLMVANGRKELFVNIDKSIEIDQDFFDQYGEGDYITLEVSTKVGSDNVTVLAFID